MMVPFVSVTSIGDSPLDTFAGNSGSGVFNASGQLVGVLSSGLGDYRERAGEGCDEVNVLSELFGGEQIGHVLPTLLRYCDEASAPAPTGHAGHGEH